MAVGALLAAVFCFPSAFALYGRSSVKDPSAPVLVEEPADTVAIPGGLSRSATLSCRAISDGSVSVIEWYKDDVAIEMASLPSYNTTNTSLVVGTTSARDDGAILEGTYYCVIRNSFGAVRSRNALVKTQHLVSSIRRQSSVFPSMEIVVLAQLAYTQKSQVQWAIACNRKNFVCRNVSCPLWNRVSATGRLLLFSLLRLTYNDIKTSISECETNDSVTIIASPSAQVNTLKYNGQSFNPRKTIPDTLNISVEVGGNTTLYCISNHPNSNYTWKRNGSPIQVDNHSRFSVIIDGVLQLRDVRQTDGGLYICSATAVYPASKQYSRSTTTNLTVYNLPGVNLTLTHNRTSNTSCDVINFTTSCSVHRNVPSVAIVCQFNGSIPLFVQVLHNADILFQLNVTDNQKSVQHNFSATNPLSSGVYQCIANNPYGSTQTSLYVLVQGSTTDASTVASSTPTVQQILRSSTPTTRRATQATTALPTSNTLPHQNGTQQSSGYSTGRTTQAATTLSASDTVSHPTTQQSSVHSTPTTLATTPADVSTSKKPNDRTPSSSVLTNSAVFSTYTASYTVSMLSSLPNPTTVTTPTSSSSISIGLSTITTSGAKSSLPTSSSKTSSIVTTTSASDRKSEESSDGLPLPAIAGGAAGGCVLLLVIILIVFLCKRRNQNFSLDEYRPKAAQTLSNNPVYGEGVTDRNDSRLSSGQMGQETQSAYDTLNKPTAFVQPVRRQTGPKDNENDQVGQYDVLNRNTDELPVTTADKPADDAYSVLGDGTRASTESKRPVSTSPSDGEYSQITTDGQSIQPFLGSYELLGSAVKPQASSEPPPDSENPYELPESEKPKTSAGVRRSVVPSDGEYSYVTTGVKRPVSTSSNHVTAGGVDYSVPHKQRLSTTSTGAYEDIEIDAQQPKRSVNSGKDSTYAVPDERKTKGTDETAVPSMTEYSYARPDSIRPMKISSDRLVAGAAVTERREEDEKQPGDGENPYSLPDETKPKKVQEEPSLPPSDEEYSYAKPDVRRPVLVAPDRLVMGKDRYALPNKQATRSQSDAMDKSTATRQPSNPPKRYTAGEGQYAVPDKQSQKKSSPISEKKSDARLSATTTVPEHFSACQTEKEARGRGSNLQTEYYHAGEDQYAVSTKARSPSQYSKKEARDIGSNLQTGHYQAGEDQYAVSAKARSPSQHSRVARNSVDQSPKRKQYADLEEFETGKEGKPPPNGETVEYATIDHAD